MIEETERGMAEFQVVSRAPMRVVALGRSGVGKSHVLNQLLRELASRTRRRRRARGGKDDDSMAGGIVDRLERRRTR